MDEGIKQKEYRNTIALLFRNSSKKQTNIKIGKLWKQNNKNIFFNFLVFFNILVIWDYF